MLATTNASGVLLELTVPQDPLCLSLRHRFFATGALRGRPTATQAPVRRRARQRLPRPSWSCSLARIANVKSPVLLLADKHLLVTAKRCQPGAAPEARRSGASYRTAGRDRRVSFFCALLARLGGSRKPHYLRMSRSRRRTTSNRPPSPAFERYRPFL